MKRGIKGVLAIVLALALVLPGFAVTAADEKAKGKSLEVVFTHDIHSHLDSVNTVLDGEALNLGGAARIKTVIDEHRAKNPDTLVIDAGDFSMGTLYQTIYAEDAAELRTLGYIGVDATTLGNHEFDYRSVGLANMLNAAKKSGEKLPEIVFSNVDWENGTGEANLIKDAFAAIGGKEYTVLDKGGVKVALFAIFGKSSLDYAPYCELAITDQVEAAKATVAKIKEKENPDIIICLSHSGTDPIPKKSEDEILAKEVPDIDVILSGHSHSTMEQPLVIGETSLVCCGEYTKRIGEMKLEQKENGRWQITDYAIPKLDNSIAADPEVEEYLKQYKDKIDDKYLKMFGKKMSDVIATSAFDFEESSTLETQHNPSRLGDFLGDAFLEGCKLATGDDIDVAIIPAGIVRDTIVTGDVTVNDIFNIFPLGIGGDGVIGYPMVNVYVTGDELKLIAEVDASLSNMLTPARLYFGGLTMTFNPHRLILSKTTEVALLNEDGEKEIIDNDKVYSIVVDLYTCQMLSTVSDMSKGLLKIEPRTKDGVLLETDEDFEKAVINYNGHELKAWEAVMLYMESFSKNADGVSVIPEKYATDTGRKVIEDSTNLGDLVKNPTKYGIIIVVVVVVLVAVIVLVIVLIVKKVKKKKRKKLQQKQE